MIVLFLCLIFYVVIIDSSSSSPPTVKNLLLHSNTQKVWFGDLLCLKMSLFDLSNKCIVGCRSLRRFSPGLLAGDTPSSARQPGLLERGQTFLFLDPFDWLWFFLSYFFISFYLCSWEILCNLIFQSFHWVSNLCSVFSNCKVFDVLKCSLLMPYWFRFMVFFFLMCLRVCSSLF